MTSKDRFQNDSSPVGFLAFLPSLRKLCEESGYALAVHGSLCRDYDMIAVAWTHPAVPAHELIGRIAKRFGGKIQNDDDGDPYDFIKRGAEPKPHGRYAWTIHLMSGPMLDISVVGPEPDSIAADFRRLDASIASFHARWKLPDVGSAEVKELSEQIQKERSYPSSPAAQIRIGYEVARRLLQRQGMQAATNPFPGPIADPELNLSPDEISQLYKDFGFPQEAVPSARIDTIVVTTDMTGQPSVVLNETEGIGFPTRNMFRPSDDPKTQEQLAAVLIQREIDNGNIALTENGLVDMRVEVEPYDENGCGGDRFLACDGEPGDTNCRVCGKGFPV